MGEVFEKKEITKKSKNLSKWYQDVVLKSGLADYAPVKGCMIIRPYGYAIWERVQEIFNRLIKEDGVENAYFPLFIPQSLLEREKLHVEGFSPELAVVTIGGGEKLKEPLVVRPTSETIMYQAFASWISSWRDLPLKINQWANVVRWEKRTYLFLRTTEFLWQEGHTAHASEEEAVKMAKKALFWYRKIYEDYYALPILLGTKSAAERFAGAKTTFTVEALMPDGRALQGATSHNLGQNFAKAFEIIYQDKEGKNKYVWQTSWGLSTRSIGALILAHGDDNGLILPPKVAPLQVVVLAINERAENYARKIVENLKREGIRVKLDSDFVHSLGWRINNWELKGVPLRVEIGEEEVKEGILTVARRDNFTKIKVGRQQFRGKIKNLLAQIQKNLFERAKEFLEKNTYRVRSYQEFKKIMRGRRGFLVAFWCEEAKCEAKIKEETKATTRLLPLEAPKERGECLYCGKEAVHRWYFAQAY